MMCSECGQRKALFRFKGIIEKHEIEIWLCDKCIAEKHTDAAMNKQKSFDIQSVISAFITLDKMNYEKVKIDEKQCPKCNMTLKRIKENSRIGCEFCYTHFFDELNTLFPKLQNGNTIHRGKTPLRLQCAIALEKAIEQLQGEMQEAVQEEAFERAAEIRDAIKELEQKKQGNPQ